jgi:hypothetical protein
VDRQGFAGELVDDVEQLEHAPVGGLIELEVQRPDVIGPLGLQALSGDGRLAQAPALAPAGRDPEAFLAPQALHALAVDAVPELAETHVRAAIAPARPLGRELAQQRAQLRLLVGRAGLVALSGRCWPTSWHAQCSLTPRRSCRCRTARRLRAGLRSFPARVP